MTCTGNGGPSSGSCWTGGAGRTGKGSPSSGNCSTSADDMKVLLIVHQFFPEHRTGTEVLTLELARGLMRKGHHVEILTGALCAGEPVTTPPWLTEAAYDGIRVHRLNYGESACPDPVALHSSAPARVELVKRVVSRVAPEIVHNNHFLGLSSEIIPALRMLRIPVLYTATDYWAICPECTLLHSFDGKVCDGPDDGLECIRCSVSRFSRRPASVAWIAKSLAATAIFRSHETMRQVNRPGFHRGSGYWETASKAGVP